MTSRCAKIAVLLLAVVGLVVGAAPAAQASGCFTPPCGEIYNNTDTWWTIKRQDCMDCGWIYSAIAPGDHRGGYWNDGIDWDAFALPYGCSVSIRLDGYARGYRNISTYPARWISFDSDQTVEIYAYTC
jgi:hypothetical protein